MTERSIQYIGPIPRSKLGDYSLVLKSQDIDHGLSARADGYYVSVHERDVMRTVEALRSYEEENEDFRPRGRARERLPYGTSIAAPMIAVALAVFFAITGPVAMRSNWFVAGTADAHAILHGEPWRAVTALTLHADSGHLLGNMLAGSIFLAFLFRRVGVGRGVFLTLAAGTIANIFNAFLHTAIHQPHRSIGASTAVFAAVGLLAATQLATDHEHGARRWTDRAGPVVGALALLGLLGSSAHSDLWAHLLGLAVGGVLGLAVLLPRRVSIATRAPLAARWQWALGILTCLVVVFAWVAAATKVPFLG